MQARDSQEPELEGKQEMGARWRLQKWVRFY